MPVGAGKGNARASKSDVEEGIATIEEARLLGRRVLLKIPDRAKYRKAAFETFAKSEKWDVSAQRARQLRNFVLAEKGGYTQPELKEIFAECRDSGYVPRLTLLLRLMSLSRVERRKFLTRVIKSGLSKNQASVLLSAGLKPAAGSQRKKGRRRPELKSAEDLPVRLALIDAQARGMRRTLEQIPNPGRTEEFDGLWPDWLRSAKKQVETSLIKFIDVLAERLDHDRDTVDAKPRSS